MKTKRRIEYINADLEHPNAINNKILRQVAQPLEFPLKKQDRKDIKALLSKFESDDRVNGLAATQFGIPKRIIIFEVPRSKHYNQTFPRSIWINPTYEKVNDKMATETEICHSVKWMVGPVKRYRRVYYKAFDMRGRVIEGRARSYMARVIQHEIDHLDGKLFTDSVIEGKLTTLRDWLWAHDKLGENDNDDDLYLRW
jgi:peptide deformylase